MFTRDHVHQVVGRCSTAENAFAQVSGLRPDLVLVEASLGLEGSPNLVARIWRPGPRRR